MGTEISDAIFKGSNYIEEDASIFFTKLEKCGCVLGTAYAAETHPDEWEDLDVLGGVKIKKKICTIFPNLLRNLTEEDLSYMTDCPKERFGDEESSSCLDFYDVINILHTSNISRQVIAERIRELEIKWDNEKEEKKKV